MWETMQIFVGKYHSSKTVAVGVMNLFNDNVILHFCEIFQKRQKQVSLDRFLFEVAKKKKISLDQQIAVIPLMVVKVVLHDDPPFPHKNHESFQR